MKVLVNQPVNFQSDPFDNPYIDEIKYKQLVQQGDITQFQFSTNEDVGAKNVLTNGTFGVSTQEWYTAGSNKVSGFSVLDGNLYYKQSGNDRLSASIQQDALVIGENYEMSVNITSSFNGYWEFYFGTNKVAQKTSGVHKIGGICEQTNHFKMVFVPYIFATIPEGDNGVKDPYFKETYQKLYTSEGAIDWVLVQRKVTTNHRFAVVDVEDSTIAVEFPAITDYLTDPYTASSYAQFQQQSLTMALDWQTQGVANGCYKIGVADADINTNLQCGAYNSEMYGGVTDDQGVESIPNWALSYTTSGYITFNINDVTMVTDGTGGSVTMTQVGLKVGVTYNYAFEIISIAGAGTTAKVYAGTDVDTYTTTGIKTGTLTCAGNTNLKIEMACGTAGFVRVNFLRIEAQSADLEFDYYSNPFNLATTHHRTFVVNCNNTDNVFGLNYERAIWSPRARLRGYIAPADNAYETEREHSETSYGKREVYYYKRRKQQLLIIENEPEFIHDWLSLLAGHDHAMINNLEYFVNEDEYPAITWDKWRVLGSTQIPISVKQALERKTIKGAVKLAQFIEDGDGSGVEGGFLSATLPDLQTVAQISGTTGDIQQLIDPDTSTQTNTTAVTGATGVTEDDMTQYEQNLTNFSPDVGGQ